MSKQYIPPADLLLKQYLRLAQSFTDRAAPQDNVLALITSDCRYERALLGIRLLARHHLGHTVNSLIEWREHVSDDVKKNYSQNNVVNVPGTCKRAAMEILFLQGAMQVLDAFEPEFWKDRNFQTFFQSMQNVSFRWLLNSEDYVPYPELTQIRQHVVLISGRVVGALSRIRLLDVCTQFVKKLEERVQVRKDINPRTDPALARSQALRLCAGMRNIELTFDTDEQLVQSTRFLQKVHPLNYTTAVKKSQIHHALCEMLTDILTPLVFQNKPHSCSGLNQELLADWHQQILKLKNDIGQWANKHNKHILVGYPLVTVLVCLVDDKNYNSLVDSMADFLAKQMKNKDYRSLCFKCLNQLVISSLVRNARAASKPQVVAWLDKIVKPGLVNARKGGISMQEQQDFVADIADLNPEYCVGNVVTDLLQADSLEAQLVALRTLYLVATSVPRNSAAAIGLDSSVPSSSKEVAASLSGFNASSTRQMVQLSTTEILDLIRSSQHPFELQGIAHLLPRVQQQIAQLLLQQHRTFGAYLAYSADQIPKDKHPQLPHLCAVIRLVPLLKPEQWDSVLPLDLLPSYTAHADNNVRTAAVDALMSIICGCPALRGTVLINMTAFTGSIPDEAASTTHGCLLVLRSLMVSWLSLIQEQRLTNSSLCSSRNESKQHGSSQMAGELSSPACKFGQGETAKASASASITSLVLDVHRLEGILFMLFCSCSESVRCDAYGLLGLLRTLHQQLCDMAQPLTGDPRSEPPAGSSAADTKQATAAAGAGASSFWSNASASENKVASSRCNIQPSGSAGSSISVEVIRQHKPTISNDSMDFMLTLGQFEVPDAGSTSIMDILEEVGDDVVHQCYWDFGDWSDLWRETKHVPLGVNLQDVMTASDEVGKLRWMRCLVELARTACHMCPTSMGVAYLEMLHKLSRCLTRDAMGRLQIPADSEVRRAEAWRAFMVVACVCPPSLREHAEKAAARKGTNLTARELIRALLAALAGGSGVHQQVCLMALGHVSPEHYPVLFDELAGCMDEYQKPGKQKKGAARPEEGRKMVANVMRLVADTMPQGTLAQQTLVRSRYLDWLRDTVAYLRSLPPFGEAFWDVCQVAYCLCAVCRSIAGPISNQLNQSLAQLRESAVQRSTSNKSTASDSSTAASSGQAAAGDTGGSQHPAVGTAGQPMTRKLLFEMFMLWCEEGQGKGTEYYNRLNAGINAALARLKDYDTDTRESLKQEMTQSAELLDQASRLAMAAMLQGPAFDPDARRAQGPVLYWIDRLLKAPSLGVSAGRTPCVPKDSVGRTALFNLLCSNLDMFSICVDRCYDRDLRIATGSFQVVSEVYALNAVKVEPHVVLSLVLYKMVDSCPEVREDALHMLHVLSTREWHTTGASLTAAAAAGLSGAADEWKAQQQQLEEAFTLEAEGGSGTVVVLGALQDSYQQFQFQLASKLARDHPELSEALCEEMMTRQLELADKVSQHPVLTCLGPWMENLTILTHWKGTWCERLLKSMYYVTLRHGDELPSEIENLWSRLANTRRNIIPILDFLASLGTHMAYQGMGAMLEYLSVGKRICLYLARVGAQQTIDHLVYEISLQLHEEETAAPAAARDHQLLSSNSQEQAAPLQFTAIYTLPPSVPSTRFPPQQQSAVAEAPGLLRSSASSWWAYSSTSSLGSSTAATPSAQIPSSSSIAASTGPSSSTGLLGSMLGLAGSIQGAVASSHTPGLNQHGSINTAVSPTDAALTPRGVKTGTMGGSGIIGSSVPTSAPSAGMGDSREGVAAVQGTVPRSMTEHSDSTRSSLSLTGQGSTAGLVGAPDQGAGSLFAAADGSLTAPRPVAVGAKAGVLSASSDLPSSANTAAASTSSLNLGGYSGTPHSAAAAGVTNHTAAGSLAQDTPAGWAGGDEGRQNIPSQEDAEPGSPGLRGLVTRPELALCLLTEVAYEHDEDFSSHLALLCHVSLLLVDHEEQLVAAAAQQLLINCLYSISARHLEMMQEQGQQVECLQATHLIKYLQSMRGRRLWPYEDLTLGQQQQLSSAIALAGLVQHCLHALSFEGELQSSWCSVAFEWVLHAHNRHLACRSQQVLRALRPSLTAEMCSTLLVCLQQCLAAANSSAVAREVALELLLTMRSLLEVLPARKLLLYPQIFWSSVSLLFTSYVHIYQQALLLLSSCLQQLPLHDSTAQKVLLAAAPAADASQLQQLLSACQATGDSWLVPMVSGRATPIGDVTAGGHRDTVRSRYGASRVRSPALAGPGVPAIPTAVDGSGDAVTKAAAVSSSIHSFVGGSDLDGVRPMHWPIAQMLPWPDRSPDGPSANMIALQQALFKGLLFEDTQLPTVQLLTLLVQGLSQLPAQASTPVQGPLEVIDSGDVKPKSRDQLGHHAAGVTVRSSSRQGARTTRASASINRESTAGVGSLLVGTGALHGSRSGRFVGSSLQQEQLLGHHVGQQQVPDVSCGLHSRGVSMGGRSTDDSVTNAAIISRSAPELRGLVGSSGHAAADTQSAADSIRQQQAASERYGTKKAAAAGLSSSWGGWQSLLRGGTLGASSQRHLPGSKAAFQSLLGHRHAQLLVTLACIVPFFCSQLGHLEPESELFEALQECMLTLSAACSTQGLTQLGSKLQQFTANLNSSPGAGIGTSTASSRQRSQQHHGHQQNRHQNAGPHGQPALAKDSISSSTSSISLKRQGDPGPPGASAMSDGQLRQLQEQHNRPHSALVHSLQGLCLQLSRALLPTYADWLLRFWMGVLLLPGAAALHRHVLLLLRCLFSTPGLQLGPAVGLLMDGNFLNPVVHFCQGLLCQHALDTLDSIIYFASNSDELQQYQQQHGSAASASLNLGFSSATLLASSTAAGIGSPAGQSGVDLQAMTACLLPQLDVVELLQRVQNSCAGVQKRYKYRLLPFIGNPGGDPHV